MKLFVWDFHGVLEKDNEKAVVEITNKVLRQVGYQKKLTLKECHQFYGLRWFEYFEHLLPKQSHKEHLQLQKLCVETQIVNPETISKHIKANDYVEEVLGKIQQNGHLNVLITNTGPESIKTFLEAVGLLQYFSREMVLSADNYKGRRQKSKKQVLKKYLQGKIFKKIIIVGDSSDDISMAEVIPHSVSYLYAHPWKKFRQAKADYKINDLREILREV